jgi:hypothetical protein
MNDERRGFAVGGDGAIAEMILEHMIQELVSRIGEPDIDQLKKHRPKIVEKYQMEDGEDVKAFIRLAPQELYWKYKFDKERAAQVKLVAEYEQLLRDSQ